MKFRPKRKTDEEYVEQMRRNSKRRWPFARVLLLTSGLVGCGIFIWSIPMVSLIGDLLNWTDADSQLKMKVVFAFALGTVVGMMLMPALGGLVWGIFWSWRHGRRDVHLMLKYHDALVAHGISPDEQDVFA